MAVQVRVTDHSGEVLAKMKGNVEKALSALGAEAVAQIKEQMEHAPLQRALYMSCSPADAAQLWSLACVLRLSCTRKTNIRSTFHV